ncbi:FliM/FliN family flagellar motor C-terminal domain-containing protein [Ramlibacter sp.]|uniref:FliM/FliN family flagellar motor C-terminal domain-containing protein n=1 Tax=Ramlibacter sp. TaxID=1917967 RepID=UPI002FCA6C3B
MKAAKLHAWRDAELAQLGTVLDQAFILWRQAWGLALGAGARVACTPFEGPCREEWQPLGNGVAVDAWVHWSDASQAELQSLFGSGCGSSALVEEAAAACRQESCRRLADALQCDRNGPAPSETRPPSGKWSGAVMAVLPCGSRLLMDAACVQRVLQASGATARPDRPALSPLVPLVEAAGRCLTQVEARLADCDLDVAMLQRLRIGDVVRLPHPLTRPLSVRDSGGRPVFDGFLARSGAHRAIELVPTSV